MTATYVHGRTLGKQICEALGLDPHRIRSVTVECDVGQPALVHVTEYVSNGTAETVARRLRSYRLVEAVDPEAES